MRSKVRYPDKEKSIPAPTEWKRWWAWYPVVVRLEDGGAVYVWREPVEYRVIFGRTGMCICGLEIEQTVQYRFINV